MRSRSSSATLQQSASAAPSPGSRSKTTAVARSTAGVSHAMRRLGAEPNFDQSWYVWLSEERHAAPIVRWLRSQIDDDARLLVACTQFTVRRDFLLIRHSLTPDADYSELHDAIDRLGAIVPLPFQSAFVIQSDDRTDVQTLG